MALFMAAIVALTWHLRWPTKYRALRTALCTHFVLPVSDTLISNHWAIRVSAPSPRNFNSMHSFSISRYLVLESCLSMFRPSCWCGRWGGFHVALHTILASYMVDDMATTCLECGCWCGIGASPSGIDPLSIGPPRPQKFWYCAYTLFSPDIQYQICQYRGPYY